MASAPIVSDERAFMNGVFGWMAGGLAITAAMAWYFASSGAITMLYNEMGGMSMLGWVVTLAPLGFILAMNFGLQRLSAASLAMLFVAFSATMGASLSSVFIVYSMGSLAQVFGITAGTFLVMSIIGYTTSTDLSRFWQHFDDGGCGHFDGHGGQLVLGVIGPRLWHLRAGRIDLYRPHRLRHPEAEADCCRGRIRQ